MISAGRIRRGVLVNQSSNEMHEFLFNPSTLQAQLTVNYSRHTTVAGSFSRLQFQNTSNITFSLSLMVNRMIIAKRRRQGQGVPRNQHASIVEEFNDRRNFLLSLCYPRGLANDPVRRSPPRALFLWPGYVGLDVVVTSLAFSDDRFAQDATPIQFTASLALEEVRDFRLTSAQARRDGLVRPGGVRRGDVLKTPQGSRP